MLRRSEDRDRGVGSSIFAKTRGLQPKLLKPFAREMLKVPEQAAFAYYLLAYAANEENDRHEAQKYLAEALKGDPELREAQQALKADSWQGVAVSESIETVAFIQDVGTP